MRLNPATIWFVLAAVACSGQAMAAPDGVVMETESWELSDDGFAKFGERIRDKMGRNLLARREALAAVSDLTTAQLSLLVDGLAGEKCQWGRVFVNGQPSVITYYLGEPKTVTEIGAFTFNVDSRANQDFEVRWANNAQQPGKTPEFSKKPDLTSGDVILGNDRGGFHTWFRRSSGEPLVPEKIDWVQFRIWRTYKSEAGQPAKTKVPESASTYIELEVLGPEGDVVLPTPEELAYREAVRKAPKKPELPECATWEESLVAGFEAIHRWECLQDELAMFNSPVKLGPWYALGPISGRCDEVKALRSATHIDFEQPVAGPDGKQLRWRKCDEIRDWQPVDLGKAGTDKDDLVLLCRSVDIVRALSRRDFYLQISADRGSARLLPEGRGLSVRASGNLIGGSRDLPEGTVGEHQVLVELRADAEGRRRFCFMPQPNAGGPGAGDPGRRRGRRSSLNQQIATQSTDPLDAAHSAWEYVDEIWVSHRSRTLDTWMPGHADEFLAPRFRRAIGRRAEDLRKEIDFSESPLGLAIASRKDLLLERIEQLAAASSEETSPDQLRPLYYGVCTLQQAVALAGRVGSMRMALADQRKTFGAEAADGSSTQIDRLEKRVDALLQGLLDDGEPGPSAEWLAVKAEVDEAAEKVLLTNPVLGFDKLLLVAGGCGFASNWGGANRLGSRLVVLSPVSPDGELKTIHEGTVSSVDLHWDGCRVLFSDGRVIWEKNVDGTGLRQVTPSDGLLRYDACYLPDGRIMFVSNACEQAVPCTGGANVGNLHVADADGSNERRITFDQDHNWNPTVAHDGRILFTRWEYTDTPHYFSRLLFRMNPDGSGQMEYYGSGSYWPNAMYWPRLIPGHPTMVSCVVSGHHGVSRVGELLLLDPARGRHEADGAVQKIPGYGKPVEPIIKDQLVTEVWPKFACPWPLAEPNTHRGAGRYFLANVKRNAMAPWELCLVDVFDNITPILADNHMNAIPLRPRPMPPVFASHVDPQQKEATVYMADVYQGPGLQGYPPGSIKQLRLGVHHYRYPGNGDTRASSYEGGWDVKKILGTVPVAEDGSAMFKVPANTPIFLQPLDAEGKAQQVMRSWFAAMPGEVLSCVGCHERQNDVPPSRYTTAANGRRADRIKPWYGPARGFSFDREVQPVLDRKCAGCHDGQPHEIDGRTLTTIDLRAKRLHEDFDGSYSPAYMELQRYVRRAGYESDYHIRVPGEYEADTSPLVQRLKKGHHNVQLTREEWERLYAWIDFNVPYPVNWRESHRPPTDEQVALRTRLKKLYAGIDDHDEDPLPLPPVAAFVKPACSAPPASETPAVANWPLSPDAAGELQKAAGEVEKVVDLGEGVTMKFVLVPAGEFVMGDPKGFDDERSAAAVRIERPFYLGALEVTNQQYACFDPKHDSGYIDGRGKDRTSRGTWIGQPDSPVVRISWDQAMAFCRWLSAQSGCRCTLPTEAQWEWACRAGSNQPWPSGAWEPGQPAFANLADASGSRFNYGRQEPGYQDGVALTCPGGRYPANAWGLADMLGNVAEWCLDAYPDYPYQAKDGQADQSAPGLRTVRGGSWADRLPFATAASRWRYQSYHRIYNVGFRVVLCPEYSRVVAGRE